MLWHNSNSGRSIWPRLGTSYIRFKTGEFISKGGRRMQGEQGGERGVGKVELCKGCGFVEVTGGGMLLQV